MEFPWEGAKSGRRSQVLEWPVEEVHKDGPFFFLSSKLQLENFRAVGLLTFNCKFLLWKYLLKNQLECSDHIFESKVMLKSVLVVGESGVHQAIVLVDVERDVSWL